MELGLVLTAFGFGFRHGIDWDHIAALTDITGSQDDSRRSMWLATLYVLGHALVVFALGVAAIALGERLPSSVDAVMERIVGVTLVVLGVYVLVALVRHGRDFRMRSRWMLLIGAARKAAHRIRHRNGEHGDVVVVTHEHAHDPDEPHPDAHAHVRALAGTATAVATEHKHGHRHIGRLPDDPFAYGERTAFGVGMIHGIGAETPTQVLIFLAAAGAGGTTAGLLVLVCFLVGLLSSNTLIGLAGAFGFVGASRNWYVYAGVSVVTALFSLAVGALFLFGDASVLPAFFTG